MAVRPQGNRTLILVAISEPKTGIRAWHRRTHICLHLRFKENRRVLAIYVRLPCVGSVLVQRESDRSTSLLRDFSCLRQGGFFRHKGVMDYPFEKVASSSDNCVRSRMHVPYLFQSSTIVFTSVGRLVEGGRTIFEKHLLPALKHVGIEADLVA